MHHDTHNAIQLFGIAYYVLVDMFLNILFYVG